MTVASANWPADASGLTLTLLPGDGNYHIYDTSSLTNPPLTDAVPPLSVANVGQIQLSGPDDATNALTIDFSGGNPIPPVAGLIFAGGSGTATNTVSISGSPDLSGTIQTVGSVQFGQGSLSKVSVPGDALEIQSGTMIADLTGTAGLLKTGSGTVTLGGSSNYQGGTAVTAGTLIVTSATALPSGSSLTVGAGSGSLFGPSTVLAGPVSLASNSEVVGVSSPGPTQTSAADSGSTTAVFSASPVANLVPATAPSDSVLASYAPATSPAAAAAGFPVWLNSSTPSSDAENSSTENDQRIAALDAVLAQYGSS